MSGRKRWAIGIAVGALVGLLGVLVYDVSGGVEVCDYGVTDPEKMAAFGISYPTELCDRGWAPETVDLYGVRDVPIYAGDIGWRHEGGSGWGVLIAVVGLGVLWWLIPVTMGRIQEEKKPSRPRLEGAEQQAPGWAAPDAARAAGRARGRPVASRAEACNEAIGCKRIGEE